MSVLRSIFTTSTPPRSHSDNGLPLGRWLRRIVMGLALVYALCLIGFLVSDVFLAQVWWYALLVNFTPLYFAPLIVLLPLMLYWRFWWGVLPMLLLVGYAVVTYGDFYLPKPVPAAGESSFSVVTFNVSENTTQQARIVAWLSQQAADVVFLQEVARNWDVGADADLDALYPFQARVTLSAEGKGAVILSRFPLRAQRDGGNYLRVVVVVGAQPIALYNVSLPTPLRVRPRELLYVVNPLLNPLWDMAWSYDVTRHDRAFDDLQAQVATEPFPVIAAGDFNMSEFSTSYDRWKLPMIDSFREMGSGFGATFPAFERYGLPAALPPVVRLDYVWHSRDLRALSAERGASAGSDHLPVIARLTVDTEPGY